MSKPKILFVTQTLGYKTACGIGLIGDLFGRTLLEHPNFQFELFYSDSISEIQDKIRTFQPDAVLYNYSPVSTPWVDDYSLRSEEFQKIPQARVMHDVNQSYIDNYVPEKNHHWKFNFSSDHVLKGNRYIYPATRIIPDPPMTEYKEQDIPIIGFQGFGFPHKGIDRMAYQVVKEFDKAVIRLHMPYAFFGDREGYMARDRIKEVQDIISSKPGIELIASHEMLDTTGIINLLAQNTINCYFYHYNDGIALSSSLDYGIAAKRPVAVTKSHQMRNVWNLNPTILIEETTLQQIIENGTEPLEPLYQLYSKESFLSDYEKGLQILLNL